MPTATGTCHQKTAVGRGQHESASSYTLSSRVKWLLRPAHAAAYPLQETQTHPRKHVPGQDMALRCNLYQTAEAASGLPAHKLG